MESSANESTPPQQRGCADHAHNADHNCAACGSFIFEACKEAEARWKEAEAGWKEAEARRKEAEAKLNPTFRELTKHHFQLS